MAAIQKQS